MKILALSQDISLLNVIDYILYKDYKIVKSTSFENLEVELNSFDLIIVDLPYWENNPSIDEALRKFSTIPLVILTEDKSSPLVANLKEDFYVKAVLKEPLNKKDLKESVKDVLKKKKQKKEKDKSEEKFEAIPESPLKELVNNNGVVFFRINNFEERKIQFISDNYKSFFDSDNLSNLKDISDEQGIPTTSALLPGYSITYKLKNSFKIVKETGQAAYDSFQNLVGIEGVITDYTEEYIKENLLLFVRELVSSSSSNSGIENFIGKTILSFAQQFSKEHVQLSILFLNKDYFAQDFSASDFSVSSDIIYERKLGEVILFSHNHTLDDTLKSVSQIIGGIILLNYLTVQNFEKSGSELSRIKQELALTGTQLAQAEAAFQDKAKSFDNLNELFNAAMKDFKTISSKYNKSVIQFETSEQGKFISANDNYYKSISSGKDFFVGKHFDDIFENTNWQNFQFEFFNNTNQEISLKQKNRDGKSFYYSFNVIREQSDNGYKYIFYGKDKTEAKSLEVELSKQVSEYNTKVNELIDSKRANELLWEEINRLKEELKNKETAALLEKEILKSQAKEEDKEKDIIEQSITRENEQNAEYQLDTEEAEIKFEEVVERKIEEAQGKIELPEETIDEDDENEEIFKNLRGIDFKIGLANAYDNIDTYNEILVNFVNDYSEFVKDIKENHAANNNEYVKSKLQTLAEESHYIGAEDLEKSAQLFNDKLSDNKVTNFDFELSVLNVHLNFTIDSIKKYKEDFALLEPKPKAEGTIAAEELKQEAPIEKPQEENAEEQVKTSRIEEKEIIQLRDEIPEEIIEENRTPDDVTSSLHHEEQKEESGIAPLLRGVKTSLQNSEDLSVIREKLFELKFQNNDFGKIEKIESVESNIELGNNSEALKILDELINS